jgi:hypothetical protein
VVPQVADLVQGCAKISLHFLYGIRHAGYDYYNSFINNNNNKKKQRRQIIQINNNNTRKNSVFRVITTVNLLLPTPVYCKSNNDVIRMKAVKSRMTRTDYTYTKRQGLYGINPTVPYAVSMI